MSKELSPQQAAAEHVNGQIDRYLADESLHISGSAHGSGMHSHIIQGGDVGKFEGKDGQHDAGKTTRVLSVEGDVGSQHLRSEVRTWSYGNLPSHVERAVTSDDSSMYIKDAAGVRVSRKADNGEKYAHRFSDPEKIRKASALIVSLASKRATRVVENKPTIKADVLNTSFVRKRAIEKLEEGAPTEKAGELITSFASKRAARASRIN